MISNDWPVAVKQAKLNPNLEMSVSALITACQWIQAEKIDVMAETEHTLLARLAAVIK